MDGGLYTWSNTSSASRLDRFLLSTLGGSLHSICIEKAVEGTFRPLPNFVGWGESSERKNSFRFENMWLRVENFVDKVKAWWASYLFQGNPSFILAKKLATLKLDLKKRNEVEFGNVTFKEQKLWNKLNDLDVREETQPLTTEEKLEQVNLRTEIEKLTLLEEISCR